MSNRKLTVLLTTVVLTLDAGVSVVLAECPDPPDSLNEWARITPPDGEADDRFGDSAAVCVDGDVAVIGAWKDDHSGLEDAGAAYVFHFDGSEWVQMQRLTTSEPEAYAHFGVSASISGDVIVVGAYGVDQNRGAAYVFLRGEDGTWPEHESAILLPSAPVSNAHFGMGAAISGDVIVVGSLYVGKAYVYVEPPGGWAGTVQETAQLTSSSGGSFGFSVSIDGDTIAVGAWLEAYLGMHYAGAAYVFQMPPGGWAGVISAEENATKLVASDPTIDDQFGSNVVIDGDVVMIGDQGDDDAMPGGDRTGSVYVYTKPLGGWQSGVTVTEDQELFAPDPWNISQFSLLLDIEGDLAVIGAWNHGNTGGGNDDGPGAAYVFHFDGLSWVFEVKLTASDAHAGDNLGRGVAISGDMALVGARMADTAVVDTGAVYVFRGLSDCNENSILDICDVENGTSQDCNDNSIPDECDLADCDGSPWCSDCNGNGIPDECDIANEGVGFDDPAAWATFDAGYNNAYKEPIVARQYIYFTPALHGEVLRYDTTGEFDDLAAWSAYDYSADPGGCAQDTECNNPTGYHGGAFDGRYVYFAPRRDADPHGEVLRYDTQGSFTDPGSWDAYDYSVSDECAADQDCAAPVGFAGAVYDEDGHVYFVPYYNGTGFHGEVLRYDTSSGFADPASWATFDPGSNGVERDPDGFMGGVFDKPYIYFVPQSSAPGAYTAEVLRFDTSAPSGFMDPGSWETYDAQANIGARGGYYGGVYADGYVYFSPYANFHGEVLRYDTNGGFDEASAWEVFDAKAQAQIGANGGYTGIVSDEDRYIYFVPYASALGGQNHHGQVLRYDTSGGLDDPASWDTFDYGISAECTADPNCTDPDGYIGGVFASGYVYFAPMNNGTNYHGEVLRYDTTFGWSPDCNGNGIPDECDLADCDGSAWCSDCNLNDVPDECDIADGTSEDCQPNEIPDECDLSYGILGDVLYAEDFEDGSADGISVYRGAGSLDAGLNESSWALHAGGGDVVFVIDTLGSDNISVEADFVVGNAGTGDFHVWVNSVLGPPTQHIPLSEGYAFGVFPVPSDNGFDGIWIRTGGVGELLLQHPKTISAGTTYHARIDRVGDALRFYLDGQLYMSSSDSTHAGGLICFRFWDGGAIDNIVLRELTTQSEDCNNNDIPDECDLADCDGSPWCDDCNDNGILDECDIADGFSQDLNGNGIPDECEASGCGTLLVQVNEHHPGEEGGSIIFGIEGLELCVFDKSPGSCVRDYGVSHRHYPAVFEHCVPVACGLTDADGAARIMLDAGDYVLIGEYDPDGHPPNYDGDEGYIGVSASDFECAPYGDPNTVTMQKHLQVIILPNGRTVGVVPGAGDGRSTQNPWIELTNVGDQEDSVSLVTISDEPHTASGGYTPTGVAIVVDSTSSAGELFLTVLIPFRADELAGADPLLVDLVHFNSSTGRWELAVGANVAASPDHGVNPIGDRLVVVGGTIPTLSVQLGDYGVFWDPADSTGLVWANVDHASEFTAGALAASYSEDIPTASAWGLIVLALLLVTGARIYFGRRHPRVA